MKTIAKDARELRQGDRLVNLGTVVRTMPEGVFVLVVVRHEQPDLGSGLIHSVTTVHTWHHSEAMLIWAPRD